jgi:hypothetical protein
MIIIWQRWGIIPLVFVIAGFALGLGVSAGLGLRAVPHLTDLSIGLGVVLAAVATLLFDRLLVRPRLDRPVQGFVDEYVPPQAEGLAATIRRVPAFDPETGEPILVVPRSSLFFIPLRFLPAVIGGLGVILVMVNVFRLSLA